MFHKRVIPYPLLQAFDRPDALQSCSRRDATIVAPQALALLNDPFVRRRAREFADRLLQVASDGDAHDTDAKDNTAEDDDAELVKRAYQLALSRLPSDTESQASREFLDSQLERRRERDASASTGDLRRLAVADFCQTLFSLNEFIFVD